MSTRVESPPIELRPYQEEALERIAGAESRGVRKQLVVAATGLGKTIMFCALARARGGRTLILAHRDELVSQAVAKVREVWPDVDVGVVKAGDDDVHCRVVVASVQTLSRSRRLDRLVGTQDVDTAGMAGWGLFTPEAFDLVVVDEAHHAAADSYRKILEALRAGELDGPLLLGVTATPDRGDGKGLDDLFDEITANYDILWGIRSAYLCDVRGLRVELSDLNLQNIKVSKGDFEAGSAGRALEAAGAPLFVYRAWSTHAADRRTLVFVPTVELSKLMAAEFVKHGVKAAHLDGSTPLDERRQILADYSSGALQVVSNCMVLTEGFDSPRTDCIIQARPTKSRALFTQIIGRGTRRHPDKTDLLVLDIVGSSNELSLVTIPSLFGLEKRFAAKMGDGTGELSDVVQERDDWLVKRGQMSAVDADLFRTMRVGGIAWVQVHVDDEPRRYQRTLGYRDQHTNEQINLPTVVLVQKRNDDDDSWLCGLVMPDKSKRVLLAETTLEMAQGVGEDYARKQMEGHSQLLEADAAWRKRKPSQKARAFAAKLHIARPEKYKTAGELSDAIDATLARRSARRRR